MPARRALPFLAWWPSVHAATLKADALAGLVGAIVVLPQGVAFAALAGLPPAYGLYCAMAPAIVAALFGSSLHAMSGPTNAVSLVVFAALSPLAVPGTPHYIELALTLALMSGVLMIAMGALGFGSLFRFMSNTVVVGFTASSRFHMVNYLRPKGDASDGQRSKKPESSRQGDRAHRVYRPLEIVV